MKIRKIVYIFESTVSIFITDMSIYKENLFKQEYLALEHSKNFNILI